MTLNEVGILLNFGRLFRFDGDYVIRGLCASVKRAACLL